MGPGRRRKHRVAPCPRRPPAPHAGSLARQYMFLICSRNRIRIGARRKVCPSRAGSCLSRELLGPGVAACRLPAGCGAGRTRPDRTRPDRVSPDQAGADRAGRTGNGNRRHPAYIVEGRCRHRAERRCCARLVVPGLSCPALSARLRRPGLFCSGCPRLPFRPGRAGARSIPAAPGNVQPAFAPRPPARPGSPQKAAGPSIQGPHACPSRVRPPCRPPPSPTGG